MKTGALLQKDAARCRAGCHLTLNPSPSPNGMEWVGVWGSGGWVVVWLVGGPWLVGWVVSNGLLDSVPTIVEVGDETCYVSLQHES